MINLFLERPLEYSLTNRNKFERNSVSKWF
jgi:hypothetical protein